MENFGSYQAVRKVGHGSSSIVFEGRRSDDDFSQRVAIKVVLQSTPAILPMSETRILAQLEHPGIARLLDAGCTPEGLRFLVMEYVDGIPCTEFAEANKLDEKARLRLFLKICDAVQFANRSLVVHCDIKPANVLVKDDGTVKLLDFGIARLLSEASDVDRQTRARFYSPDYASPEQIEGRPLTVATDVYSLGALLRELAPLAGDLELIAEKALRQDPSQRYGSVADLAADIKGYLEGRPVMARPLSRAYRLRKFVGRHRLTVLSVAAVVIALLTMTVIALRQRRLATERFAQIRTLANSVLYEIHDEIAKLPGSLNARHLLADRSVAYLVALANGAGADDDIQLDAAKGFVRLADIEGVGNEPSLGKSSPALARLERADGMLRGIVGRNPRNIEALRAHYLALEALATIRSLRADPRDVRTAEEVLQVADKIVAARPGEAQAQEERAMALCKVANAYTQSQSQSARGVEAWQRATAEWKRLFDQQPQSLLRKRELARSYQYLAGALSRAVKREEARSTILLAYQMHKELAAVKGEEVQHMIAADVGLLGNLNAQLKRYAEAIPMFEEQLRLREEVVAHDPNDTNARMGVGASLDRIGYSYVRMKQASAGLPYLERALAAQRPIHAKDPENTLSSREMLYALSDLAEANEALGRRDRMCQYAAESVRILHGAISRTRETAADAAKKTYLRKTLVACGVRP